MAKYVKLNDLRSKAIKMFGFGDNKYVPLNAIENAAVEIGEGKFASWKNDASSCDGYACPHCGSTFLFGACNASVPGSHFCPNCGKFIGTEEEYKAYLEKLRKADADGEDSEYAFFRDFYWADGEEE